MSGPIQMQVNLELLRKKRLMVATPMYGGMCTGPFAQSMMNLIVKGMQLGVHVQFNTLYNESLVQRARNYLVDDFIRSDCTHFLFIDADIHFNADEVFMILNLMDEESDYDIMCGPYPKKTISWEKIKQAVDKGAADENPAELENYVGDFVFNPLVPEGETITVNLNEPFRVREAGTGYMMIRRDVFEKYTEAYPEKLYTPDHVRSEHFAGDRKITAYFDCVIDPVTNRYLSEDYYFCVQCEKIGIKTWLVPWVGLKHVGSFTFGGTIQHLASIQADLTAMAVREKKFK